MAQANRYLTELFEAFEILDTHGVVSRPIPASFDVQGYFFRYEEHFVYWKRLGNGDIGIVTVLHERMHQIERVREDFEWQGRQTPLTGECPANQSPNHEPLRRLTSPPHPPAAWLIGTRRRPHPFRICAPWHGSRRKQYQPARGPLAQTAPLGLGGLLIEFQERPGLRWM